MEKYTQAVGSETREMVKVHSNSTMGRGTKEISLMINLMDMVFSALMLETKTWNNREALYLPVLMINYIVLANL